MSQQAVATELRLAVVLMALWPWFLLDDLCMTAVLELLCVYTANCTVGQSSERWRNESEKRGMTKEKRIRKQKTGC